MNDPYGDHLDTCPSCRQGTPCGVGQRLGRQLEVDAEDHKERRDRKFDEWEERKDKGS